MTGGGSPFPLLFDLERVEVLKGPQGTLFGASSEGGTVRFITPQPSLIRYSGLRPDRNLADRRRRPELRSRRGRSAARSIQDKLGFRVSLWKRHIGGYIDHVSYL